MGGQSEVRKVSESPDNASDVFDVIIIGAGAAGIGAGIALDHSGVDNYIIIDRGEIGSSHASVAG